MCKEKKWIKAVNTEDKVENDKLTELFIETINIDVIDVRKDWIEHLKLTDYKDKKIAFKIDTGAQCNVIPSKVYDKIGIKEIENTNVKLSSYTGEKIETRGKVKLNCKVGNIIKQLEFQVFQGSAVPILGLASACELK